jgi:hypothetical protein
MGMVLHARRAILECTALDQENSRHYELLRQYPDRAWTHCPLCVRAGVKKEYLHFVVYTRLLDMVLHKDVSQSFDPNGVIKSAVETGFPLYRYNPNRKFQCRAIPRYYRPRDTRDQVTAELEILLRRNYDLELPTEAPLRPIGLRVDPRDLSARVAVTAALLRDTCSICQEWATSEKEIVKLKVCEHLVHLECFDELINQAYPGYDAVGCPLCRFRLCAPRDYKAALNEAT